MAASSDILSGVTAVHLKYLQFDDAQRDGLEKSLAQSEYMDTIREALRRGIRFFLIDDSGRATHALRLENGEYRIYLIG